MLQHFLEGFTVDAILNLFIERKAFYREYQFWIDLCLFNHFFVFISTFSGRWYFLHFSIPWIHFKRLKPYFFTHATLQPQQALSELYFIPKPLEKWKTILRRILIRLFVTPSIFEVKDIFPKFPWQSFVYLSCFAVSLSSFSPSIESTNKRNNFMTSRRALNSFKNKRNLMSEWFLVAVFFFFVFFEKIGLSELIWLIKETVSCLSY